MKSTALALRDGVLFYCNNEAVYNDDPDHGCPRVCFPFLERTQMEKLQFGLTPAQSLATLKQGNDRLVNNLKANRSSRREFMRLSGLAVGATGLALPRRIGRRPAGHGPRPGRRARPAARGQQAVRQGGARPSRAEAGGLRAAGGGAGAPRHHRRVRGLAGGTRTGLRSGGRRPVRGPRGGEHRQRRGPHREGEHRVRGRGAGRQADHGAGPRASAARSRPPSSTSTPTTPCPGRSATSSTSSGRPPSR